MSAAPDTRKRKNETKGKLWHSRPDTDRWLASKQFDAATPRLPFRIEGWLAERGTSMWFGAGSTGKTQLLLWMAASIASRPEHRPATWLGGRINGTGNVLVLTAEDAGPQIVGRIRDIVMHTMGQSREVALDTCSRIHVMPFMSMTESEFAHPNASLMHMDEDRVWRPSEVMQEIREYIEIWNARHVQTEDQIIGVILDSATSMAGFDGLDAEATTNFFFYLGRLCEALGIFFTIIGHVPKAAFVPQRDPWGTAASRLRGVAMWTTAPRMAVEVRLIQEWRERGKTIPENKPLRDSLPGVGRNDILVVYAAKANLPGVCTEPQYLVRSNNGAFEHVTGPATPPANDVVGEPDCEPHASHQGTPATGASSARKTRSPSGRAPLGRTKRDPSEYEAGTKLVIRALGMAYPDLQTGDNIVVDRVHGFLKGLPDEPAYQARNLVFGAGGTASDPRPGGINWHFSMMTALGIVEKRGRFYYFLAWNERGDAA